MGWYVTAESVFYAVSIQYQSCGPWGIMGPRMAILWLKTGPSNQFFIQNRGHRFQCFDTANQFSGIFQHFHVGQPFFWCCSITKTWWDVWPFKYARSATRLIQIPGSCDLWNKNSNKFDCFFFPWFAWPTRPSLRPGLCGYIFVFKRNCATYATVGFRERLAWYFSHRIRSTGWFPIICVFDDV